MRLLIVALLCACASPPELSSEADSGAFPEEASPANTDRRFPQLSQAYLRQCRQRWNDAERACALSGLPNLELCHAQVVIPIQQQDPCQFQCACDPTVIGIPKDLLRSPGLIRVDVD